MVAARKQRIRAKKGEEGTLTRDLPGKFLEHRIGSATSLFDVTANNLLYWQFARVARASLLLPLLPVAPPPTKHMARRHFRRDLVAHLSAPSTLAIFLRYQVCKAQFAQLLGDLSRLELEGRGEAVVPRNRRSLVIGPRRRIFNGRIDSVVVVVGGDGGRDDPLLHQAQFVPFPFRMLQIGRRQIETTV